MSAAMWLIGPYHPGIDSLSTWMYLHPPRGSTIVDRQKVSLIAPSFSTVTAIVHRQPLLTVSAQVVDGAPVSLPCVVHRHRPSTTVTHSFCAGCRWCAGFAALCRAAFWLVADPLQHVLRPPPTFSPHRHWRHQNAGFWLAAIYSSQSEASILVSSWVSYFTHNTSCGILSTPVMFYRLVYEHHRGIKYHLYDAVLVTVT